MLNVSLVPAPPGLENAAPARLRCWVEIDLGALLRNARRIQRQLGPARFIAVVKKDAYGHGALECSRALQDSGLPLEFAVCTVEEGLELRHAGIARPILVLTPAGAEGADEAVEAELICAVLEQADAAHLHQAARRLGKPAHYAFKFDTGMGRLGHYLDRALHEFALIHPLERLRLHSIYSHFADIDGEPNYSQWQYELFQQFVARCGVKNIPCHLAQSGALTRPRFALDGVRVGKALYGIDYENPQFEPVMTFKSRVIFKKKCRAGDSISYGRTFVAPRDTQVAVIGAGYGNGYLRAQSNAGEVLIDGRRAPVIGRVCMDQFMIDANAAAGLQTGDEAILFGRNGESALPAWEAAERAETISYELCCLAGQLNPRVFLNGE